ncbi:MAG: response regulator transcription factor [Pseudomonadales bacterium]|nr:response regulator transcription factor [Pseudomonadales bacterium]
MRILVVEDEADLQRQLAERLRAEGYVLDTAGDGAEGLYYGSEFDYDAAIIDLGLPKLGGIELIQRLRAADRRWPILVLTARGDWRDKVAGLEAGADDYLTKPFQMEELLARLHALLRRAAGFASPVLACGPVELDMARKEVRRQGEPVEVTAYEYKVLEYLMLNPGRVVSKTELTDHLYDQDFERDSNVIEVFVGRLRKKLDPFNPIRTIRGQGYRLNVEAGG